MHSTLTAPAPVGMLLGLVHVPAPVVVRKICVIYLPNRPVVNGWEQSSTAAVM